MKKSIRIVLFVILSLLLDTIVGGILWLFGVDTEVVIKSMLGLFLVLVFLFSVITIFHSLGVVKKNKKNEN